MNLDFSTLNLWAQLVAIVIGMVVGSLWYSPLLFGNVWMNLIQKKREDMVSPTGPMIGAVVVSTVNSIILGLFLHALYAQTIVEGLTVAALLALVIIMATLINYLFEGRAMKLLTIQVGYHVVVFLINSILLTQWT
jgi:high-affinity Fe2+/Pb2+ permease